MLGQDLADEVSASSTERRTNRRLAHPRDAAGQREVREIHTGEQQDDRCGGKEQIQGRFKVQAHWTREGLHDDAVAFVGLGILRRQAVTDGFHLRARLVERDTGFQLRRDRLQVMRTTRWRSVSRQRSPELRIGQVQTKLHARAGRHDADNRLQLTVEPD